ncbi:hypothetical protein B0H13DRAFT_2655093 [Mycena leptocephala]|nr:hypothetical protein B0H13DRAFT_2655093 [Mycena leptocephala]
MRRIFQASHHRKTSLPHSIHTDHGACGIHPLAAATWTGNTETARLLLDAGTSLTAEYEHSAYHPLHFAAPNSLDDQTALRRACAQGHLPRLVMSFLDEDKNEVGVRRGDRTHV